MVQMATFSMFRTFYIFAVMAVLYWPLVPICLFALIFMVIIVRKAMVPQRECIRMDTIYRGPIHSQFALIVNGLVSVRCYQREKFFRTLFIDDIEKSTNITFCFYAVNRWMGTWLDHICLILNISVIMFAVS